MRDEITWHQLVEWYQFYLTNPFGVERADLRAAINGCAIVNEIRVLRAAVAGFGGVRMNVEALQVKDLLPTFGSSGKSQEQIEAQRAKEYAKAWARKKQERLEEAVQSGKVIGRSSRQKSTGRKRK